MNVCDIKWRLNIHNFNAFFDNVPIIMGQLHPVSRFRIERREWWRTQGQLLWLVVARSVRSLSLWGHIYVRGYSYLKEGTSDLK
jgi:hypothetical protein